MPTKEEKLRADIDSDIQKFYAEGNMDKVDQLISLRRELPPEEYVFDQLSENQQYVKDIHNNWVEETGRYFTGTDKELIEKEFEYWNNIENNLTTGAGEILFHFKDMDSAEKDRTLRRFNVYDRTKITGEGSRDIWEQTKGVGSAMLSDPLNWVGGGLFAKILSGPALRKGFGEAVRNVLKVGTAQAGIGGAWGATEEAKRQLMEQELEAREGFDSSEIAESAKISAATGVAFPLATKAIGAAGRTITHPLKSSAEVGKRMVKGVYPEQSKDIALEALSEETRGRVGAYAGSEGVEMTRIGLGDTLDEIDSELMRRYDELEIADIDADDLISIVAEWESTKFLDVPNSIKRDTEKLIEGTIDPQTALRLMRKHTKETITAARKGTQKYDYSDIDDLTRFKVSFTNLLEDAAEEATGTGAKELDRSYAIFKSLGKKDLKGNPDKYGKLILKAAVNPADTARLIRSLSTGETAIHEFSSFMTKLYELDDLVDGINISRDVLDGLQKGIAYRLTQEQPAQLSKFMTTDNGIKFLTMAFPEQKDFFQNTHKLFKEIEADKIAQESVGGGIIKNNIIAGFGRKVAGPVGSLGTIVGFGKLLGNKGVRQAIINSYQHIPGSTIQTRTKKELSKILDPDQVKLVQDMLWSGSAAGAYIGAEEAIDLDPQGIVEGIESAKERVRSSQLIPMPKVERPQIGQTNILPPSMRSPDSLLGKAAINKGIGAIPSPNIGQSTILEGGDIGNKERPYKERIGDVQATLSRINQNAGIPTIDVENETYASLI